MLGMVALTVGLLMLDSSEPPPIDWTPTFVRTDKAPFGAYILYESLPAAIGDTNRSVDSLPVYNVLSGSRFHTTYFFLNSTFDGDVLDVDRLMTFVRQGNIVFIAAEEFCSDLEDSLNFTTDVGSFFSDSIAVNLLNPALRGSDDYHYPEWMSNSYFSEFDTVQTTVLGAAMDGSCNYIEIRIGEGRFYLSTLPYAFTNYNLIDPVRSDYAVTALSYLPKQPLIWDEYYKDGKEYADEGDEEAVIESPLRYVLGRRELRAALYLALGMLLLFVFFAAKRRQRIIPVIHRPQNTSLEFAHTVGRLYYQHGDHRSIAEKMIGYFLEYVRSSFGVDTGNRTGEFRTILARRSGVDRATVERVFSMIDFVSIQEELGEEDLDDLNTAIETFHAQAMR